MIFSSEVRVAEQRAVAFAERLWTDRFLNRDPELRNLMNTRIISGLTRWLFNSLSRHLMSFEMADRKGTLMYRREREREREHNSMYHITPHHTCSTIPNFTNLIPYLTYVHSTKHHTLITI